ncbi:hypothetical protein MOMA_04090 [Moraxella macacae 0408225]|uniref:Large ribosomal RNA subunit accumulation protein YceD n=1 Tax=Moraxella macacae 0408225 TaxID=1230338 RepID=L2F940_9GAMM|nr:YceD family protein [Moraxella macacae]ELA09554.1 hypothetical protein MOMA_04090 [Moraxella macacae 0408225]
MLNDNPLNDGSNCSPKPFGVNCHLIKYIDLAKWEYHTDNHYHWQGKIALQQLPRVRALADERHNNDQPLLVNLEVKKTGAVIWWQLSSNGVLWQTCQRCLEPVAIDLNVKSELALLEKESHVGLLDENTEYLLLSELTKDNKLYLLSMIEDELLVALPLAPKHDDCKMAVTTGETIEVIEEKQNPFAILANLAD